MKTWDISYNSAFFSPMDYRGKSPRHEKGPPYRSAKSPLLGLRHAMCSPAPRERQSSDDSIESPRSSQEKVSARKTGGFPSIKVEKCDALPPVRQSSASSDTGRRTPSTPVTPVSPEGVNNLFVPSPVHQRRSQDGRVVMVTNNLQDMKIFSKSDGDLEEAGTQKGKPSGQGGRVKRIDANFRPKKMTRPTVHLTSSHVQDEVKCLDVDRSPTTKRKIHLMPLKEGSRTKSDNDLSAI